VLNLGGLKPLYKICAGLDVSILQERRQKFIIYAAVAANVLASVVWLIAISTDGWVELILPDDGVYLPSLRHEARGRIVLVEKIWKGLWNLCRVEYGNATGDAADTSSTFNDLYTVKGILYV